MSDILPAPCVETPTAQDIADWQRVIAQVARHYRITYSAGSLQAAANWQSEQPLAQVLKNLGRQAGLQARILNEEIGQISRWQLPLAVQLRDGQIGVILSFDGEDRVAVCLARDAELINRYPLQELLSEIRLVVALRPSAQARKQTAPQSAPQTPERIAWGTTEQESPGHKPASKK